MAVLSIDIQRLEVSTVVPCSFCDLGQIPYISARRTVASRQGAGTIPPAAGLRKHETNPLWLGQAWVRPQETAQGSCRD